ncbi:MAG: carbohydrate-binding protein [Fibrobacteres bacterium]|nr:carbohydrate-binding protein [Fibrobacterota bacterium]
MRLHNGAAPLTNTSIKTLILSAGLAMAGAAHAQLNHGCPAVANTDFKLTTVVARSAGIDEPIKMTFDMDAQGNVDIYWVERLGKVKKYAAATKAVTTIATLNYAVGDYEGGVTGIALDPSFKTNRMMYIYYSMGKEGAYHFRVSRFQLNSANVIDMASERVIIQIPASYSRMHTGGAMLFDEQANLYITTGENQSGEEGPPNTNDLRGKILRIHPIPFAATDNPVTGLGTTYTVPDGNLFPKGMEKTRPEIYVMGTRNPYSLTMDPVRKVITWGDIGPDGKGVTEEHNLTGKPGNFGYPYFAGNNILLAGTGTAAAPVNNNTKGAGLVNLPPAQPAINSYIQEAAITGPIYRYDGHSKSTVKLPPHFDGAWFVTDFQTGYMDTISLNKEGTAKTAQNRIFSTMHFDRPIDLQVGPDGALYIMNYAGWFGPATTTGIQRIEYSGTCRPELATALAEAPSLAKALVTSRGSILDVAGANGAYALEIGDLQGRTLAEYHGSGDRSFDLTGLIGNRTGLYTAKLVSGGATSMHRVLLGAR